MNDVTNIQARINEIDLVQEFLANRKSEIEGQISEFNEASNRFLEKHEEKADRKATIIQCAIQDFPFVDFSPLLLFPLSTFESLLTKLLENDFKTATSIPR